ncbi:MAG: Asp/Glu/hydantoin racemase [Chelatococcus sp.]|uniref:aspartate racemase/maleate isomerase family protein n=1 Tax=unclassified Chelatococcus TaxID=2638111 RepID=UPI001BCEC363|nr:MULTISPECIES: aspartate/glutamate racemase family protein [unclassified Chelatococcus]CAH1670510.1 putative Maleate isomerase [Hyphomicrobiales bacterium]MBS7739195.1 Asp/Glu/hydantoin racemase [Chelatococcus sp. HY11]MBX3540144.1 Asp/Glu/hydantoin racemase [Chelatococcus sp.]MBX3543685.1 Asp/Glu/hydantoin racemase [Chelatococcus sp.]MCO5076272.1 aspartate/glutamate racemase family protein [Chelatococcus sp.]
MRMPRAIGIILPSSNRVVERVTRSILDGQPGIDACFTRVPYAGHPPDGYDMAAFRRAAEMLAQARPEVILWNATRGALIGFEPDRRLAATIRAETGIPCTTTALATIEYLRQRKLCRIGLVAQGGDVEGHRLRQTFEQEGIDIAASHNLDITDNFEAANVRPEEIEDHALRLARTTDLDAVLVWSTNLAGYALTGSLREDLRIPVLDSAALGVLNAIGGLTAPVSTI